MSETSAGANPEAAIRDPEPAAWPVLVTGASGFLGGHVARSLAQAGHRVRGLSRKPPAPEPGDPPIEWLDGDLLDLQTVSRAVQGVRGVIHTAGWVSLGPDPQGLSRRVNVEATAALLAAARSAGVERFVFTSTIHTLAAGTAENPADESTAWNLECVESPYGRSKREAERLVLDAAEAGFGTVAFCPGMLVGPRDPTPTSTRLLIRMARARVAILPNGGIPILDARIAALAHRRALTLGEPGARYALVGPYLSYPDQARLVARITGRPWRIIVPPDRLGPMSVATARRFEPILAAWSPDLSAAAVAGGFLKLHVRGDRADRLFGLTHPEPIESIRLALLDARRRGRITI